MFKTCVLRGLVSLALPDLMTFLMAVPSLMVGLSCFLAALMHVTGLVDVSLNALP